jgi:hypothetical protein
MTNKSATNLRDVGIIATIVLVSVILLKFSSKDDSIKVAPAGASAAVAAANQSVVNPSSQIAGDFKEESANLTDTFQALSESGSESIANVLEPFWIVSRAIDDTVVMDVPPEIEATSGTLNSGTSIASIGGSSSGGGTGDSSSSATGGLLTGGAGTSGDSTSSGSGSTDAVSSGQDSTGVTTTTGGGGSGGGMAVEQSKRLQHILSFFKTPEQQFMPLGFYAMAADIRDVERLKALRQRGIILFHIYDGRQTIEDALADLQAAREAGVGILQNLPRMYVDTSNPIYNATEDPYFNAEKIEYWQQHITALAGNDLTLLVWDLPEEVKAEELDKLEQIGNIIRATDTKHRPLITYVWVSDAEYLKRVSSITDAVVFGTYPSLHGNTRIDVKQRIDLAYKNGVPVVIAALEALEGKFNWVRPKDVRFDAYLALISGAKGIMWYAYYYAKPRPELLEAVLEVATELNGPEGLGEVLLSGKEPNSLKCRLLEGPALSPPTSVYVSEQKQYDSVQWTAREYKNYLYIFAVNTAQKVATGAATDDGGAAYMIKVKFGPISSPSSKIQIIGESRVVDLSDGYFIDTFEPLGTHIYKVKLD